jgi:hypothetical protein
MDKARYTFGVEGSMHLIGPALELQGKVVEPFFDTDDWQYDHQYFEAIPALYRSTRPTALGGLDVALVFVGFLGTFFAEKIFDAVYERTLDRPIGTLLDKLFNKVDVPAGKVIEYRDIIYFEDIDLVVVIRAIATKETTGNLQSQIMQAHRVAHSYIKQHGKQAPIHCHNIQDGLIALEPELFRTLEHIKQHDMAELKIRRR